MMPSRHQTRTRPHTSRTLFTCALLLGAAATLEAQTVNPRIVEFDPSPDHNTTLSSGQSTVSRYDLEVYLMGASAPFHTVNMGKPSAQSDGKIRFDFSSQVSAWPLPGGTYVSTVSAVGPNGTGRSDASNTFMFQSTAPCTYSISPGSANIAASGGSGSFTVTAGSGCAWTASKSASWVTLNTTSGSGNGTVSFSVTSNDSTSPRTATISAAGQTFTVTQAGVSCSYSISPANASVGSGGGTASFALSAHSACSWTASSSAAWLTVQPGSGSGNNTITVTVAANGSTSARTGTVTAGGQTFTVSQAGATPCTYSVSPGSANVPASGGSATFTVTTAGSCSWTATTTANWIGLSRSGGSGSATVNVSVAPNADTQSRSGTVSVGGQTLTVTQAAADKPAEPAPCTYSVSPGSANVPASGGSASFTVTTAGSCSWTATTTANWIGLSTSGGSGSATVSVSVATNADTQSRSGIVSVGGQTFVVTQAAANKPADPAPCTYSVSPTLASFTASGGSDSVTVTTGSACAWTTSSPVGWISVGTGSGSGSASVTLSVGANSSASPRAAAIVIAGQSVTVNQAGVDCSISASPSSQRVGAGGGSGSLNVTAPQGCSWTASTSASWLKLQTMSGSGSGSIGFAAERNPANSARAASVSIADQAATISQDGQACSYAIEPATASVPSSGGSGQFALTADDQCAWTVTSSADWLSANVSAGSGSATITFTAERPKGNAARAATLTVGSQVFTVTLESVKGPKPPKNLRITVKR